jgi:hypothetical protein
MIFKKCINLLLVFLLLVSNVGVAFNVHYCGNQPASISLKTTFENKNLEKNCCGVAEKKSHCCKNKVVHFQKKKDNATLKAFSFQSPYVFLIPKNQVEHFLSGSENFKTTVLTSYYCDANAPPLFQLYSQYIFYA